MWEMKDLRYLIRLDNIASYQPFHQETLLKKARKLVVPLGVKIINLRVSRTAIEFDLFCSPQRVLDPIMAALEPLGPTLTCRRLDPEPNPTDAQSVVSQARNYFNEERFWEVHEVLEGLWKQARGADKELLQGLILIAAAFVHVQKNEIPVVEPMLKDALRRLQGKGQFYHGIDLQALQRKVTRLLKSREIIFPTI